MNSKSIGDITTAKFLSKFMDQGYTVLIPWGDNARYDLVVEKDGQFLKIQCKTARVIKGSIEFSTASTYGHRGRKRKSYIGEADYFGVYCAALDKCFLIPVDEVPSRSCARLRVQEPSAKCRYPYKWAGDFAV